MTLSSNNNSLSKKIDLYRTVFLMSSCANSVNLII